MKLIFIFAVLASSYCAKLDRTYLPPHALTSGGSANILETPNYEPRNIQGFVDNFGQNPKNSFPQNDNLAGSGLAPTGNFANYAPTGIIGNLPKTGNYADEDTVAVENIDGNSQVETNGPFETPTISTGSGLAFESPERPRAAFDRNAAILRMDSNNDGETYAYAYETDNGISADESGVATNGVEAQGGFSYTGDDGKVYSIRYTADQNGFVPQGDHLPTPPPVPEEILKALEQNAADEAAGIFDDGSYDAAKYGTSNVQYSEPQYDNNNNYASENNLVQNTGNYAPENNIVQNTGNYAPENNFAQNTGNNAPENNFAQNTGNYAPENNFEQGKAAPENAGIIQDDEDTVITNSAADFPKTFENQRVPEFRGVEGRPTGPAYLPPVGRR